AGSEPSQSRPTHPNHGARGPLPPGHRPAGAGGRPVAIDRRGSRGTADWPVPLRRRPTSPGRHWSLRAGSGERPRRRL
ncbi:MAG: hypothetical protein AVDCRST_MAG59-928, partial [uncultured Thermomicrobiales bacterium]